MSLRRKTLLVISITILGLILIIYAASRSILLRSFSSLEEEQMIRDCLRALNAFSAELSELEALAADWAAWDDTYAFIVHSNEDYVRSNLVDDTFLGLNLNLIIFADNQGRIIFQKAFDSAGAGEIPVPAGLQQHITPDKRLLQHTEDRPVNSGFLLLPEGPILLSSHAIVTSKGEGPIRGSLILGRYLDEVYLQQLAERTQLSLSLLSPDDASLAPDRVARQAGAANPSPIFIKPLDGQRIAGFYLLRDLYGDPAFYLGIRSPRDLYQRGLSSIRFLSISIIVAGLTFGLVTLLSLEKVVLTRLATLSLDVRAIGRSGDRAARLDAAGQDELAGLANDLNTMMQALEQSERTLRESEARYRAILEAQSELICRWQPGGKLTFVNDAYCRYFDKPRETLIGSTFLALIPEIDRARVQAHIDSPGESNPMGRIEHRVMAAGGEIRWNEWNNLAILDAQGRLVEFQSVGRDITERKNAEEASQHRLRLDRLITDLSANFLSVPDADIGAHIERALQAIGEFSQVDRSYVFLLSADGQTMDNTQEWCAPGIQPQMQYLKGLETAAFPWWLDRIRRFETIHIPQVADLPEEANAEREIFESQDIQSMMAVPLADGDQLLGFLGFDAVRSTKMWTEEDITMLKIVGDVFVNALQRMRIERELRRRADELAALHAISLEITLHQDLSSLLHTLTERAVRLIDGSSGGLYLCNPSTAEARCVISFNTRQDYTGTVLKYGEGAAGLVAATGEALILEDYHGWPGRAQAYEAEEGFHSIVSVPISWQGQVTGIIHVINEHETGFFGQHDVELLTLFANYAAVAIQNATLIGDAERRAREAETLRKSSAAVVATLDRDIAIDEILLQLERVVPYDSASVQLLKDGHLEIVGGRGWPDPSGVVGLKFEVPGDNPNSVVIQRREPYILSDAAQAHEPFRQGPHSHIGSWLGVPLVVHETLIGMLAVDSSHKDTFNQEHARLASAFADQVAIALHNVHLFEAVQKQARKLAVLNRITATSLESRDLPEMLQSLADQMCELLESDSCYMKLWDEERQRTIPAAACGALRGRYQRMAIESGQITLTASALELGRPLAIEDISSSPHVSPDLAAQTPDRSVLALPLIAGGQKYGAALIGHSRPHLFSPDEIESGQQAAAQVALAVAKTKLLDRQRRSLEEMEVLQATAADISTVLEVPQLLSAILERACTLLKASGGDLCLLDEKRGDLEIVTNYNMRTDYSGTRIALGEGAAGRVAVTRVPLIIEDYQHWEQRLPIYSGGPWRAVMVVPMLVANRLIGVIGVFDDDPDRHFSPSDEKLLTLLAQQSAIAIVNARLYEIEKTRAAELALLFESSTNITKTLDFAEVLKITAEQLASAANGTSAYVLTYDQEKGEALVLADYYSPEANELEKTISDLGVTYDLKATPRLFEALRSGHAWRMRADDIDSDPVSQEELRVYGIKSALALPMMLAGRVHAYAEIWDSRHDRDWSEDEVRLCQTLANQATITIENARLFDETQHLAITDPLTGLYNRRGLFQLGDRELDRVRRFGHPLAAIMLDIDHFKQINDTYSHAAGDVVLQALAERCLALIRDTDILGRYGGEEFALLLPETDLPGAQRVAERLRMQASATPVMTARGPICMTISLGLTAFSPEIPDLAVLLDHADTAMYAAKQNGRDRVVIG